jgi:hypothetical protein
MHDGFKNKIFFVKDKKSIILISLTPKQVYKHRLKLKRENITENESIYMKERFFHNISLLTRLCMILMVTICFRLMVVCFL